MNDMQEVDLRQYFWVLRRWLWLILLCTALAAASAYVVSLQMTPIYGSAATLLVHQAPSSSASDYTDILVSERLARTYAQMITGRSVLEAVIGQLELSYSPGELSSQVSVELVRDTQLINLSVEDTDPTRAAVLANTIAEVFIAQNQALQEERYGGSLTSMREQIDELSALIEETQAQIESLGDLEQDEVQPELARLETILAGYRTTYSSLVQNYEQMRLTAMQSTDNVTLFETAQVQATPIRPRTTMNTALAGVVGAMLAIGVAFLIEYLDDTIKTPDDLRQASGLEMIGLIGRLTGDDGELVTLAQPLSPISESYRVLRTNIQFSSVDRPLKTLLVSSPGPLEGKSITVANLAVTMAQAGLHVIIVDCDLRRPRQHQIFGLHPRGGLTRSLLEGRINGRLQSVEVDGLEILPVGDIPPNPVELLGSQRMIDLLEQLSGQVDVVLIDSPPVLPVADAAVLGPSVDGVILVAQAGHTRRQALHRAVESLQQVRSNLIGVILNSVPTKRGGYYYNYSYYQYYGNGNSAGSHKRDRKGKRRQQHERRFLRSSNSRQSKRRRRTRSDRRSDDARAQSPPSIPQTGSPVSQPSKWGRWIAQENEWIDPTSRGGN